jgi:ABC-2 type transport system permease protein
MAHSNSVYDSSVRGFLFKDTFSSFYTHRSLIALLVRRDLTVRYKRSFLGLIWSLLNPLLTSLVLWFVFVYIFRPMLPDDTQFAPYLLAGVLTITFFTQGLTMAADSISKRIRG